MTQWWTLLALASDTFTRPGFALFEEIVTAWVLCPTRHTMTNLLRVLGPGARRAHDAYHRWLRSARWDPCALWAATVRHLVRTLQPDGLLKLICDDSHLRKSGPKVEGAGSFRDPIRSTKRRIVYLFGLNVIALCLRVQLPGLRQPVALPINLRVYRKRGPSHLDLVEAMFRQVADWLPDRSFDLVGDGAYAALAKRVLPRSEVVSRMRCDAAIYDLPPPRRPGQRGRPRKCGPRLPTPRQLASQVRQWQRTKLLLRGRVIERLLHSRPVLWYGVCGPKPVLLVIVRDLAGKQPDDFFFTTRLDADPATVVSDYAGRWAIEVTFRDTKQHLGAEHPQTWKLLGPERAAHLAFWLYTAIWSWYALHYAHLPARPCDPWYRAKAAPLFADARAALRTVLWQDRISLGSMRHGLDPEITDTLVDALARAG
jgi:hypothetical protein